MTIAATQFENAQVMEVGVSGPDDAKRLYICTGVCTGFSHFSVGGTEAKETLTFLVGPVLKGRQFIRAVANRIAGAYDS